MKRANATAPYWNGSRWIYTPYVNNKQRFFSSSIKGPDGKKAVLKKYSDLVDSLDTSIRFGDAWKEHLADRKAMLGDGEAYSKTESIGRIHLIPRLKHQRVQNITDQDWQNCITLAKSEKVENLSKKTLSNIRSEIMLFCRFAKRNRWIDTLPDALQVPKTALSVGKDILHPEALKTLLRDSQGDWYVNTWRLMVVTGLRPGEAYGLKWTDIKKGLLTISRSINRQGKVTQGKNDNAHRTLYLSGIANIILQEQKLKTKPLRSEWIFCDDGGAQPVPSTISNHWLKYREKNGISNITQYGLRHTFVSVSKTALPEALMKQTVGHSQSMDTLGIYGKEIETDKIQAANIIDGVFSKYKTIAKLLHDEKKKA